MLCLLKNWFWKQKSQQGTYQIIKLLIDTIHGLDSKKKKKVKHNYVGEHQKSLTLTWHLCRQTYASEKSGIQSRSVCCYYNTLLFSEGLALKMFWS